MIQFDLKDLFSSAFGYEPPEPVVFPHAPGKLTQSSLGQPYYGEDIFGREFFLPVTINGYLLPFAVLGMTWKKTIVSTPMPERGGSVKELISLDDYQFNIKGILINDGNEFPESQIIDLHKLFIVNASLVMHSVISDIVLSGKSDEGKKDDEGHRVVIKEIKWPEISGVEHARAFEMNLESDLIFDLEID